MAPIHHEYVRAWVLLFFISINEHLTDRESVIRSKNCQTLCGFYAKSLTVCGKSVRVGFAPIWRMRKPWWQLVTKLYYIFITLRAVLKWQCAIFNPLLNFVVKSTTSNILSTSLFLPRKLHYLTGSCFIFHQTLKKNYYQPNISLKRHSMHVARHELSVYLLLHVSVCECVCGKGGTHCLLPRCHWAASPNQQPCRPDRRWARLLLQPILCSPSAAPDSAGRSPLEEGRWGDERKRAREEEGKRDRRGSEREGERETALVSVVGVCGETRHGRQKMFGRK